MIRETGGGRRMGRLAADFKARSATGRSKVKSAFDIPYGFFALARFWMRAISRSIPASSSSSVAMPMR